MGQVDRILRKEKQKAASKGCTPNKSACVCVCVCIFGTAVMYTDDVVLRHTLPVLLGRCPIVSWDFAGAVSIFGPDALPVIHQ